MNKVIRAKQILCCTILMNTSSLLNEILIPIKVKRHANDVQNLTLFTTTKYSDTFSGLWIILVIDPPQILAATKVTSKVVKLSLIHFALSSTNCLCVMVNTSDDFFPSWFLFSLKIGKISSTFCKN